MKKFICILILFVCNYSFAQINDLLNEIEQEELNAETTEELFEQIGKSNNNLFNINNLSPEQMTLLGLNNFQQFCLQDYIKQTGQLFSLHELQFINGFDKQTIEKILPFICCEYYDRKHSLRLDSIFSHSKQSIRFQYQENLHKPYGYTRTDGKGYLGEKFSSSFRYYLQYYDRLDFSIVADKDAGEPLYYKNKTLGYDHYNISLTIRDISKHLKQLTLGDYRLSIAEGLAMKQSFDVSYLTSYGVKNKQNRILPFRSTSEYDYNKGLAMHFNIKHFDLITFASYNSLDYNGSSIQQTGYHRTEKELSHKDSITQTLYGANLNYSNKGFSLGLTAFAYHFSDSITPNISSYPYMQHYFQGKNNNIISLNSSYVIKNFIVFAEVAKSQNNAFAYILGTQYTFDYKSSVSLCYRNYDEKYQNFFANAIGIHDDNQNERGLYLDYSHRLNNKLTIYLGADLFYFPFKSYRADTAVYGQKAKLQLNYIPNKRNKWDFYARLNNRQYNFTLNNGQKEPKDNVITQAHLRFQHFFTDNFSLNLRSGYSRSFTYKDNSNYGMYFYGETIFKTPFLPLHLNLRYTYFHTTDYNNHFNCYEYSLPLTYSSASLSGQGHRFYALLTYKLQTLQLSVKYSITRFHHTTEISSSNDKIYSNNTQYLSAQIYWEF